MSAQTTEFKFECPHCGQRLEAEVELVGLKIACPACGKALTVPFPDSPDLWMMAVFAWIKRRFGGSRTQSYPSQNGLATQDEELSLREIESRSRKTAFIIAAIVVVVFVLFNKKEKKTTYENVEPRQAETVQNSSGQRQREMAAAMLLTQLLINQNATKQRANIYPTEDDLYPNSKGWRERWRKEEEQSKHERQVKQDELLRLKTQEEYYREQRQRYPYNYNPW